MAVKDRNGLLEIIDGLYEVTKSGELFSIRNQKYLRPTHDKYGYKYYTFSIKGKRYTIKAHRLVALMYIDNPQNKPTVNHINGIRDDNRVENLEWATHKEQQDNPLTKKRKEIVTQKTDYYAMGLLCNFMRKKKLLCMMPILLNL